MARGKRSHPIVRAVTTIGAAGLLAGIGFTAWAGRKAMRMIAPAESLLGKVVLITGASRGLGFALAEECARQGCRLAICGRDEDSLERAESGLRSLGAEVLTIRCDVGHRADVTRMVDEVIAHYGRIDVLINNAGTISVGPFNAQTSEDFQEAMDVMFWGAVHASLAVIPHMLARREGKIANITSIGGRVAVPHLLPYSAAKFAIVGFSEGLTAELANKGIKVTTVVPGLMRTGSHVNAYFKGNHRAEYAWFGVSASTPLLAMNADRAAKRIVGAIRRGDTDLVLGFPAKAAAFAHGLFPATTVRAMGVVNRVLPDGAPDSGRHRGHESESAATSGPLTAFGKKAVRRWNQEKLA